MSSGADSDSGCSFADNFPGTIARSGPLLSACFRVRLLRCGRHVLLAGTVIGLAARSRLCLGETAVDVSYTHFVFTGNSQRAPVSGQFVTSNFVWAIANE